MKSSIMKSNIWLAAAMLGIALSGLFDARPAAAAGANEIDSASAREVDSGATAALNALYQQYPAATALAKDAKAILVFPKIFKAGLVVGGESGNGVMRVKGKTTGYYNTSGVSYGLQIGAQNYGYALFLMTDGAVASLGKAEGFEIGVGPSVVVMDDGLAKKTTTTTAKSDIYAFIFSQKGLMAGLGIQGSKITKLNRVETAGKK